MKGLFQNLNAQFQRPLFRKNLSFPIAWDSHFSKFPANFSSIWYRQIDGIFCTIFSSADPFFFFLPFNKRWFSLIFILLKRTWNFFVWNSLIRRYNHMDLRALMHITSEMEFIRGLEIRYFKKVNFFNHNYTSIWNTDFVLLICSSWKVWLILW